MEDAKRQTQMLPELESAANAFDNFLEEDETCDITEYIGPYECWNEIGMRIRWTIPEVPGEYVPPDRNNDFVIFRTHEPVTFKLCLECKKPVPIREVTACAWTHLFHANNHEGIFRKIKLLYDEKSRKWDDVGVTCYEFQERIHPTQMEHFRIWVNKFEVDHIFTVHNTPKDSKMVDTLYQRQITKNITTGNYLSSLLADEMGYDVVLNLDKLSEEQVERTPNPGFLNVIRLFSDLNAGGGNEIPEENLFEIVKWLRLNNRKNKKILVSDYCGVGRTGSAMTAYIYANNPNLTYDEAYEFVRKKSPASFCHKGLRDIVTRLYPRD